jgi:hypothetical protein
MATVIFVTGNNKKTGNNAIFLADIANDVINAKLFTNKDKKIKEFRRIQSGGETASGCPNYAFQLER